MSTRARAALAGAAIVIGAVGPAGPVASAPRQASGLHDARYCEIIELKGAPPDARATVWNTIGLNDCPAGRWKRFDAGALARELGDSVVVLNGPRHFLMDAASGETGGVRSFHGLRMRKVATIPIRTVAELAQTPYTDRTIERRNTWRWSRGRLVHELVAPGGDTYVMQSYAQIRDPTLTIGKLRSLGRRLDLPAGWRYRTRRLRHDLVLTASGRATIVQDDLLNTYQLATAPRRPGERARRPVSIRGVTRMVTATTPGTIEDRGTVTGTPFGRGTITVVGTLKDARLTGGFRLVYPRGSISGTISMPFTISGNEIDFRGTARLVAGTGTFRGISSPDLQARDHNTLDGQSGTLAVNGSATY